MKFEMTNKDYMNYLENVSRVISENKDYITALDAKTGDGDHWVNMNMGFQKVLEERDTINEMNLSDMFKKIAMLIMNGVGGSSGVLYGCAYIGAAKALKGKDCIDQNNLVEILEAQMQAIMERGKAEPGQKTMIDPLYQGVEEMKKALAWGVSIEVAIEDLKSGAHSGMEATRDMEAVKGRASYQKNKGMGELDPGAVTMYYQIVELVDYIKTIFK
ncbi:MAG: dihydroxyacetone kinase subunit DhaL [Eubacteriales bacterium]